MTPKSILITGSSSFVMKNALPKIRETFPDTYIDTPSSYNCDLRDATAINDYIFEGGSREYDIVIHAAARVAGIMGNIGNGGLFMYENLVMGANLLEVSRSYGVKKFINLSSICSFPEIPKTIPFIEDEADSGIPEKTNKGYGQSKRFVTLLGEEYAAQYGLDFISLLCTNMMGPMDNVGPGAHVIPNLVERLYKAIQDGSKVFECYGTGKPTRDFMDSRDFAQALIKVIHAEPNSLPRRINLGSGKETSIKELVYKIADIMGYKGEIVFNERYPDGQPRRVLDISRAKQSLGWTPQIPLQKSLEDVVSWYQEEQSKLK